MRTRRIGSLEVSVVGLGCNNFGRRIDLAATTRVIDAALDAGVNFLDTADIYSQGDSETFIGQALGDRRANVIIATKYAKPMDGQGRGAHPDYITRAVDASLRRLRTDYIDLYQQHEHDPSVPIADTLGALDALVKAGKVREIGCSNFSTQQLQEAERAVRPGAARFVSVQNEYSLMHREPEQNVLDTCTRLSLAFLPYFPLASGLLTGKYRLGQPLPAGSRITSADDRDLQLVETLIEFAKSRDHTILELAFSWLLAHPAVASVIAGATKPEQVHANVSAANWQLTPDDLTEIDRRTQRAA